MAWLHRLQQSYISRIVNIGNVAMGGTNPIRLQSMTSTDTLDTKKTVAQSIRMIEAGCELVRITTPGIKEAENLRLIKKELKQAGFKIPLIADIHFSPKVAEYAARIAEKIRINPGNYTGSQSKNKLILNEYDYQLEIEKAADNLYPLLKTCKEYGTVVRLGVNHGSLSERIIHKYGNTPTGMVESILEFIRICENFQFHDLVLSMKSSNLKIMVQAYRLLVNSLQKENMNYPLHLGVTEAGNGLDGRIKSTAGIGTLIQEGIGDTLRVSLTEEPENEIIFAKKIIALFNRKTEKTQMSLPNINPFEYHRRKTLGVDMMGRAKPPAVISSLKDERADYYYEPNTNKLIGPKKSFGIVELSKATVCKSTDNASKFIVIRLPITPEPILKTLGQLHQQDVLIINIESNQGIFNAKTLISSLMSMNIQNPIVVKKNYSDKDFVELIIRASTEFGELLVDGLIDGIWIENREFAKDICDLSFRILQACGSRISRTEFIACPSCGRTKFNIQKAFEEVKKATQHLCGLKIAVMGCVVNGPGEMADADYGYIGVGSGKVNLYKSRELIKQGINEKDAVSQLVSMIKEFGDWKNI